MSEAVSRSAKDAKDHIPFCRDQGLPNLVGCVPTGMFIQHFVYQMVAPGGVITFPYPMYDTNYWVHCHNHTTEAKQGTIGTKTITTCIVTGPANGEMLDVIVIGKLKSVENAVSHFGKDAKDHIPFCRDQGIPNLVGCPARGTSIMVLSYTMAGGGLITFPFAMANALYTVQCHNHTTEAKQGTIGTKLINSCVITGPAVGEAVEVVVIGNLRDQLPLGMDMGISSSRVPKDAQDHIPYCKDQGIINLVGSPSQSVSIQSFSFIMGGAWGGLITFPAEMADATYRVITHNHTGEARQGTISLKTTTTCTVTGPNGADVLDVLVIGKLKGQLPL